MNNEFEGLRLDHATGDYMVLPGYGYFANRFRIDETWLDEDDNLWIKGSAVERLRSEGGLDQPTPRVLTEHASTNAA